MDDSIKQIYELGLVPVIKIEDAEKAVPLAKALSDGGLPCAEITFRTDQAGESIRRIADAFPGMLVGAGTVLSTEQADRALDAGAKFIVSPGFSRKVVEHCLSKNVMIVPGCSSPSDIEQALDYGLEAVKFFPAEASGGIEMIRALSAPYSNVRFIPTGGISTKNLLDYLNFGRVIACGGTWMAKEELINAGEFEKITQLTREAVSLILGFEAAHIGINGQSEADAEQTASQFSKVFGFEPKPGNSSIFAGKSIEITKTPFLGRNGHIAIAANNMDRAVRYMKANGYSLNMDTAKFDDNGRLLAVYLETEFGGFAVHLVQKK